MRTKSLSPFLVATKLTSTRPPRPEMTIVVRGAFALRPGAEATPLDEQGKLSSETYREDDDEQLGECSCPNDFAEYKPRAEVLLQGRCHTPNGKLLAECPVRVAVGAWSKTLRVTGHRVWSDDLLGAVMSAPIPFTSMPLDWSHGFGGPGFAKNPSGKGYKTRELPNVEHPSGYVRARGDTPDPAGFGPVSPRWPSRAAKMGTAYGRAWRKARAPFFAEDFDWTFFQCAPADQQLEHGLTGDEEITLVNLHPEAPSFSSRLPAVRVRAFVEDTSGAIREVPMILDTLLLQPDEGRMLLTWRGVTPVADDDFADVKTLLVASEPLAEKRRPEEHYRAVFAEIERDPLGIEKQLRAHLPADQADAVLDQIERQKKGAAEPEPDTAGMDPLSALLTKKLGKLGAAEQEKVRAAIADIKAKAPAGVDVDAKLAEAVAKKCDEPPVAVPIKPGVLPDLRLRDKMRRVMAQVELLKKAAAEQKASSEKNAETTRRAAAELAAAAQQAPEAQRAAAMERAAAADRMATAIEAAAAKQTEAISERVAQLEALPHHPKLRKADPEYAPPGPISTEQPGPGRDLREQDLSHRDLAGMDLRGANLENAVLTGANLRGANLAGAKLKRAIFYKADLSGAILTGADLTQANMAAVRAVGADLSRANLEIAFFEGADLSNATLEDARGEWVVLTKAKLAGIRAARAVLDRSHFTESDLTSADLSSASLVSCWFEKCRAARIDLTDAFIRNARFPEATLEGAKLVRARGFKCLFQQANLADADLALAVLPESHFIEASAVGARFYGANLKDCRFHRAALDRASFMKANLFGASLAKARLAGASFRDASLYAADLRGASGRDCDFLGAVLTRSSLAEIG